MFNDTLIERLDQLRESYAQRQRATANLAKTLKETTDALAKAGRALQEYAAQGSQTPDKIANARDMFGALRLREDAVDPLLPDLRREEKALGLLSGALKDALAALRAENVDVIKLGRAHKALRESKLPDVALGAVLPDLDAKLQQAQQSLGFTFGQALRDALAAQGITIGGRPPRFEIEQFELAVDFVGRSATLSYGKEVVAKKIPLSVEAVLRAYQSAKKAIVGRNEDGARWMELLYTAWENTRRRKHSTEPRVSIVETYVELAVLRQPRVFRSAPAKGSFVDYTRAQFAYDFATFAIKQDLRQHGLKAFAPIATKSQTENAERSIWLVTGAGPHDGAYVADLKFDQDA